MTVHAAVASLDPIAFTGPEVSGGAIVKQTALASGDTDNFTFSNLHSSSLIVVLDITAKAGTVGIIVTIEGVDPVSGKHWTILASASQTGTGTVILRVSPNITASANLIAQDIVPPNLNIKVADSGAGGGANTATYTIAAYLCD